MQINFLPGTKCLLLPQYVNRFLAWHKKFGSAQNTLRPVKGQGIIALDYFTYVGKEFTDWTDTHLDCKMP